MKSSFALTALLFLPNALAIAVPHVPKLVSKRFGNKANAPPGENVHLKRDQLEPRQPRGRPLVVAGGPNAGTTTSGPAAGSTGGPGHLPFDPQQQAHNSIVGGHPFYGHGPVVNAPNSQGTNGATSTSGAMNLTVVVPVGTGTVAPIQNATAIAYAQPVVTSCPPQPVGEYVDSNGNFLPTDQQPGYNGSISTNGTVPGNCAANADPVPVEEIVIEGHVDGDIEIVDIDIIPLNGTNATSVTNSTNSGTSSSAAPPPRPSHGSGTGTGQRVPAVPVGFTGP
ncbi:MAG: hypothetical protein Q9191_004311 [Dirinaria sp. TL-2023a]